MVGVCREQGQGNVMNFDSEPIRTWGLVLTPPAPLF